jgi:hypothetical protein
MIDGFKIGTMAASLEASYEFYFGKRKIMGWNAQNWGLIPERMRIPPGSFLQAVFSNDLMEAFPR